MAKWTDVAAASALLDDYSLMGVQAPELGRLVMIGSNLSATINVITSDNNGATWTSRGNPFHADGGSATAIAWNGSLFVLIGAVAATGATIYHSTNAITWTAATGTPTPIPTVHGSLTSIAWSETHSKWVAGATSDNGNVIFITPGSAANTWNGQTTPFDGGSAQFGLVSGLAEDPHSGIMVAVGKPRSGSVNHAKNVMTSTDLVSWTPRTTGFDDDTNQLTAVIWSRETGFFIAVGFIPTANSILALSGDGIDWDTRTTPFDGGQGFGVTNVEGVTVIGGIDASATHSLIIGNLHDWFLQDVPATSSEGFAGFSLLDTRKTFVAISSSDGVTWITANVVLPVIPTSKFFQGYPWRFLFTDIPSYFSVGGVTTTWADGLLTDRQMSFVLNGPATIAAAVWPDDPRVNAIFPSDNDPLVAQSNRLVYAFRREAPAVGDPWVCRAAGILMSPEDQGDTDVPLTHFTAYDPWQFLAGRPVMSEDGQLPSPDGALVAQTGDSIVTDVLRATIVNQGFAFVDAGLANGGTSFYSGTIETTNVIVFEYQRGMTVADVWTAMCDAGNMDIVLTPIYDPINRPGYTHELNIYKLAGAERPTAIFGWDMLNRALNNIDRLHDGTPGNFINVIQYYAGQGGFPVPPTGPLENTASVMKYLAYWSNQFQTTQGAVDPTGSLVLAMAQQQLTLSKQGQRTTTVAPTPERSPVPFRDYTLGDRVPIYTTKNLRVASSGYQRVQAIPITVDDDGIETVPALLCSPDWREII